MRSLLVTLAVLSLVVRWADSPCGCALHNGWIGLICHVSCELEHGHDHEHHEGGSGADADLLVVTHGCAGECGKAIYATGVRLQPVVAAAALPEPPRFVATSDVHVTSLSDEFSSCGIPLSRAALKVYQI